MQREVIEVMIMYYFPQRRVKNLCAAIGVFFLVMASITSCHGNERKMRSDQSVAAKTSTSAHTSVTVAQSTLLKDFAPCSITSETLETIGIPNFITVNQTEVEHTQRLQKEIIQQKPYWQQIKKFTTCVYNEADSTHPGRVGYYFDVEKADWTILPSVSGYIAREKHRLLSYNPQAYVTVEKHHGITMMIENAPQEVSCDIILVPYVDILGNLTCGKIRSLAEDLVAKYH